MTFQTILYFSSILLGCVLTGLLAWYAWRQRKVTYYRAQYETAESLRKSQEQYQGLIEHAADGIFIADANGKYLEVNPSGCAMLGYTRDEILSKRISDLVAPEDLEATPLRLDELRQGKTVLSERRLIRKDGNLLPVEISGRMLPDGRFQSIVRDITERKQAEDALRESQVRVSDIINSAMDAIITVDEEQKIVIFNPSAEQMFGYPASEAIGSTLDRFLPEYIRKEHSAHLRDFGQSNSTKRSMKTPVLALTCLRANGEAFLSEVSISQVEVGGRKLYTAIVRDITERKQAEAKLAERHATLNAILESAATPVFSLDRDYRYTSFNSSHAAVMKALYGAEIEIGKNMLDYQAVTEDRETARKNLDRALSGEQIIESAYSGEAGRTRRYFEIARNPIQDIAGEIIGVSVFVRDITERKRIEESLQEYNTRLETEVEERTRELREMQEQLVRQERLVTLGQFAGSIGHELRNPLGVISNAVYFLKMSQPNASDIVKEYLDIIETEARTSDKIVTDLLDFTRIKSLDRQPASVSELIRQTLERHPVPPSMDVALEIPADLPQIYADPLHVIQVLVNLISNACQAMDSGVTNDGKLKVSAAAQGAMIKIDVQDTGVGIPPEYMKKIFEPLFTTKTKGIGLGLAVSRKLTEANRGRIEAESEAGKGSTFTVYLPVYEER